MQTKFILWGVFFSSTFAMANSVSTVITEKENTAIPDIRVMPVREVQFKEAVPDDLPIVQGKRLEIEALSAELGKDKALTERLLNIAIESGQIDNMKSLLSIYQTFSEQDLLLVLFAKAKMAKFDRKYSEAIRYFREMLDINPDLAPVRIELGIVLFLEQHNNAAKEQFEKVLSHYSIPLDIQALVNQYLTALEKRESWKVNFSVRYLNENNVNNAASSINIENTPFIKGHSMLPQKASGIGYSLGAERDFNLADSHYLHLNTEISGKNYWDNRDYTESSNRIYLGYSHKKAKQQWSVLPFYERQWYAHHQYKWASGVRGEYSKWLNDYWQFSTALEYAQNRHYQNTNLNGNSKLASMTFVWQRKPSQFFYAGLDLSRETTIQRSLSYDVKTVRVGWGQEWGSGVSSRISATFSNREYKGNLRLGSAFLFPKVREDNIYSVGFTLWNRDWHVWGITPKLHYIWKKQDSNFDSLYSYSDKNVNLFFEKSF